MENSGIAVQTISLRIAGAFLPGVVVGAVAWVLVGPYPQPLSYHEFADQTLALGIPHIGDVSSNLAFTVVGAWGMWFLSQSQRLVLTFLDTRERWLYWWFFLGVFLTGFGSGWYHLEPDNYSLVWDRLPMTVAFMSIFAVMIAERVKLSLGFALLWPLLAVGVASVLWWIWTEYQGQGDLRWYLFVQFYPMLTMLLMLLLLPTRYTHGNYYWGLLGWYAAAKVVEILDHQVLEVTGGIISGHSLKHLLAAVGGGWLLLMLWRRQPRWQSSGAGVRS